MEVVCTATLIKQLSPAEDSSGIHSRLNSPSFNFSFFFSYLILSHWYSIYHCQYLFSFLSLKSLHHLNVRDESALSYKEESGNEG